MEKLSTTTNLRRNEETSANTSITRHGFRRLARIKTLVAQLQEWNGNHEESGVWLNAL